MMEYRIPGRVRRAHHTKIGHFSKQDSPPLSHHRISGKRHHRHIFYQPKALPLWQCNYPRVLEWLELDVAGPCPINPDHTQPCNGHAALRDHCCGK
jgi:hypothetical protein